MASDDSPTNDGSGVEGKPAVGGLEPARSHQLLATTMLRDATAQPRLHAAYQYTLPEMQALQVSELNWPYRNILDSISVALEYAPKIHSLRPEFERHFSVDFRLPWVDAIERYALATLQAYRVYIDEPAPEHSFPHLVKEAAEIRIRFVAVCQLLVARNRLDKRSIRDFDGGVAPEDIACDLFLLRGVLRAVYPKLSGKIPYTSLDLIEAEIIAETLLRGVMQPERYAPLSWAPADLFIRAYTLLERAYHEARRGIVYVRWDEDDAHLFAPKEPRTFAAFERRHYKHNETEEDVRRRAHFVTATLTAVLRGKVVDN